MNILKFNQHVFKSSYKWHSRIYYTDECPYCGEDYIIIPTHIPQHRFVKCIHCNSSFLPIFEEDIGIYHTLPTSVSEWFASLSDIRLIGAIE